MAGDMDDRISKMIRARLAQQLGSEVSNTDWSWLEAEGDVADAVDGFKHGDDLDLLDRYVGEMAKKLVARRSSLEDDRLIESLIRVELPSTILSDLDAAEAIARSYVYADQAQTLNAVVEFRQDVLAVFPLDEETAIAYLAKRLPASDWLNEDNEREEYRSNIEEWISVPIDESAPLVQLAQSLFVTLPSVLIDEDESIDVVSKRRRDWYRSPLYHAAEATADLLPWSFAQSVWFILTNAVPYVSPLRARVEISRMVSPGHDHLLERGRVTVQYDAWLSSESLQHLHTHIHRDELNRPNKGAAYQSFAIFTLAADLRHRLRRDVSAAVVQRAWQQYLGSDVPSTSAIRNACRRVDDILRRPMMYAKRNTNSARRATST